MKKIFLLSLVSILMILSASAQDHEYSFTEKFKVNGDATLKVKNGDGFIHVSPSDNNTIQVFFIVRKDRHLIRMDRNELEEEMDVIIENYHNEVEIMIRHKKGNMFGNWRNRINVSLEIYAPASTTCNLRSSDGDVFIREMNADQVCRTSDGDIKAIKIGGALLASTSDGDIIAKNINGYCELETSDGDINAYVVKGNARFITSDGDVDISNINGHIYAKSSDGDITFEDISGSIDGVTSDGSLRGNMIKVNDDISLHTSDGNIELTIPEGLGLDLRLRGENIRSNLSGFNARTEGQIRRSINGGGFQLDIRSSDGTINLYDTDRKQR